MSKDQMKTWINLFESIAEQESESNDLNSPLAKAWRKTHFQEFLRNYQFPYQDSELNFAMDIVPEKWALAGTVNLAEHESLSVFGLIMGKCSVEVLISASNDNSILYMELDFSWEHHSGGRNGDTIRYIMQAPGNWEIF
jgi:hypothetical protein